MARVFTRKPENEGKDVRVTLTNGTKYLFKANNVLVREDIARALDRCGWPTTKLKVRQHGDPPVFYVNIGYLRGLDPDALYKILCALPAKCGVKKIFAAIEKLPERVESGLLAEAAA